MGTIEALLSTARTLCNAECGSKKRSLELLAELIAESSDDIEAGELFELLIARERLGSTGIGHGIAIPHCRCKSLNHTVGALITLGTPIDFDSVDSEPVDIIFAMLVPDDAQSEHLQTLAKLAEQMQKESFVSALRRASSQAELYQLATGF